MEISSCPVCGCLLGDPIVHEHWHKESTQMWHPEGDVFAERVIEIVAARSRLSREEMLGRHRTRKAVAARHTVWVVLRLAKWSYPEIGDYFERDHSTILEAVKGATPEVAELARNIHQHLTKKGQRP